MQITSTRPEPIGLCWSVLSPPYAGANADSLLIHLIECIRATYAHAKADNPIQRPPTGFRGVRRP